MRYAQLTAGELGKQLFGLKRVDEMGGQMKDSLETTFAEDGVRQTEVSALNGRALIESAATAYGEADDEDAAAAGACLETRISGLGDNAVKSMNEISLVLGARTLTLRYPANLQQAVDQAAAPFPMDRSGNVSRIVTVIEKPDGAFSISRTVNDEIVFDHLVADDLPGCLAQTALSSWSNDIESVAVLNACPLGWRNKALLVAGNDAAGKATMTAWFRNNGFAYLSHILIANDADEKSVAGSHDPLIVFEADGVPPSDFADGLGISGSSNRCGLMIFAQLTPGVDLEIRPVSPGIATMRLMQDVVNGRKLSRGGLPSVADIARRLPALDVCFGDVSQLDGVVDRISKFFLDGELGPEEARRLLSAFCTAPKPTVAAEPAKKFPVPDPTPRRKPVKLTIGMATYDDFDGVYFSIQALRLYHPEIIDEVEYLVIDNHPDGPCSEALKSLESWIPNYRYVPELLRTGSSQAKNQVFEEASGEFVVCMDCHVFVVPGALKRLLDYYLEHPHSSDLLQGPLIMDDLAGLATHFKPGWGAGMYGQWDMDQRGADPDAPPFEIPMQGMGLFTCRRNAWLGFNPEFRGFGAEEGYIHEKFRQRGRRTLCLPFLRWLHRFNRPMGVPYPIPWEDRIRNYLIGYKELGLPSDEMETHFSELAGEDTVAAILRDVNRSSN